MNRDARVFVAGNSKALGSAVVRALSARGWTSLVGLGPDEPDHRDQAAVAGFFRREKPEIVVAAAGKAGGIGYNRAHPAELMEDNLLAGLHLIRAAREHGTQRLLYLASSCIYPRECPQPIREEALLTGPLEPTNEAYALAKIAGVGLCAALRREFNLDFTALAPTNYFGPGDDFSPENSHVIGALMARMARAARQGDAAVEIWGSGKARREFLYVDDVADAVAFLLEQPVLEPFLNIGGGETLSIAELAAAIREVTGYAGELRFDAAKPDGMLLKSLDGSRLAHLGWRPSFTLRQGLEATWRWYRDTIQGD